MPTQCPECKIDHKDLPGYEFFEFTAGSSMCPSCGCFVKSPETETTSRPVSSMATPFPGSVVADFSRLDIETPLFHTEEFEESADTSPTPDSDLANAPTQRTPPFRLSVKKVPQRSDASSICLEIKLTNLTRDEVRGHLWLSNEDGSDGQSKPFTLSQTVVAISGERNSESFFPQIPIGKGSSGHPAVRIQPVDCGEAFWQGDLLLSWEKNGSVSVGVNIDKSINAENYLEGIRNGMSGDIFHINTNEPQNSDHWHEVRLRLRGPKDLAEPADASRPSFHGRDRPVRICKGFDETPRVETARITLSSMLPSGRDAYVQLIAGKTLHLGRARTWDPKEFSHMIPNDIILRTLATDEYDDYISRYHGVIRLTEDDVMYENFSKNGSDVTGRTLRGIGESTRIRDNVQIFPGKPVAKRKEECLGLHVRRTSCVVKTELYKLLVQDSHLVQRQIKCAS